MLFQTSALPLFTHFNMLLQRQEPTIHILKSSMEAMGRKLAMGIMKGDKLRETTTLLDIDLESPDIFKHPETLYVGNLSRSNLRKALDEGDISERHYKTFFEAIHYYFKTSLENIKKKFLLDNPVICNAAWVNVPERLQASWENVQFFVDVFPGLIDGVSVDTLYEEFVDYQCMNDADIVDEAWEEAKVSDGVKNDINDENNSYHYRVDILWWYTAQLCIPGCSVKRFKYLIKLAKLMLIMPHSNAELERLFSIVRKNKTLECSSLKLDGTVSGILT